MIRFGIDPGVNTGFAWSENGKLMCVTSSSILQSISWIKSTIEKGTDEVAVYVEDASLRKWYGERGDHNHQGVGSVKRDCGIWKEFAESHEKNPMVKFKFIHPKNNATKMKSEQFQRVTGWKARTNVHGRDAAMLIYGL